ncbi:MAG: 2-succinyl-6-hydroxy-2,4-cyclohexadiene-1-carboxylate synthase [SAR324 cluster bacterium]|nr:2-succinyl-6-hydroxy-2,4-cyclohexadiene-1-carboxylate synthase [SAR324 cluster bacterium]
MNAPLYADWDGNAGREPAPGKKSALSRPTILLIHGFAGDSTVWAPFRERLRAVGDTVAVDLIGHGRSPCPVEPERYRIEACLDDLERMLERRASPPAWWVGYSMGGRLALTAAVNKPHLVRGVVLESTTAGISDPSERRERVASDSALADAILVRGMEAFVDRWLAQPLFASLHDLPPERFHEERARRLRQHPTGLANSLRGMGAGVMEPLWGELHAIKVPVLVIAGEADRKYAPIAAHLAESMPHAELRLIPGAGHIPHVEAPETFLRVISDFIGEQEHILNSKHPSPKIQRTSI